MRALPSPLLFRDKLKSGLQDNTKAKRFISKSIQIIQITTLVWILKRRDWLGQSQMIVCPLSYSKRPVTLNGQLF